MGEAEVAYNKARDSGEIILEPWDNLPYDYRTAFIVMFFAGELEGLKVAEKAVTNVNP